MCQKKKWSFLVYGMDQDKYISRTCDGSLSESTKPLMKIKQAYERTVYWRDIRHGKFDDLGVDLSGYKEFFLRSFADAEITKKREKLGRLKGRLSKEEWREFESQYNIFMEKANDIIKREHLMGPDDVRKVKKETAKASIALLKERLGRA
jgi:hypothetical protein